MRKRRRTATGRRQQVPLFLIGAGVLLVLGVLLWQVLANAPTQPATQQSDIPYPEIGRVSLADSKAALDQQSAIFLDVRDPVSFDTGHIPGAINIPLDQLENRLGELDASRWIITYCT